MVLNCFLQQGSAPSHPSAPPQHRSAKCTMFHCRQMKLWHAKVSSFSGLLKGLLFRLYPTEVLQSLLMFQLFDGRTDSQCFSVFVPSGQLSKSHKTDKHYCLSCVKECQLWHFSKRPVSASGQIMEWFMDGTLWAVMWCGHSNERGQFRVFVEGHCFFTILPFIVHGGKMSSTSFKRKCKCQTRGKREKKLTKAKRRPRKSCHFDKFNISWVSGNYKKIWKRNINGQRDRDRHRKRQTQKWKKQSLVWFPQWPGPIG